MKRKLAVLLTAAALTAAAATGCTGGKETEAVAAGAGTGTETGTTAFPFFSQLLMILQTSPNTYRSNLHIFPFRSNSGMKSEGYMIPLFGCFQRTRASAPERDSSLTLYLGWTYNTNCSPAKAASMLSVIACSRSSLLRSASS